MGDPVIFYTKANNEPVIFYSKPGTGEVGTVLEATWNINTFVEANGIEVYNDEVYACNRYPSTVHVYNLDGVEQRSWGGWGAGGDGNFYTLSQISSYSDGNLYLADATLNRISVMQPDGTFVRKFTPYTYPYGVFVYGDEVYVTSQGSHNVSVYNLTGTLQRAWGSVGGGDDNYSSPKELCVYGDEVYVVDNVNDRIKVTNLTGVYQREFGSAGTGDGELQEPYAIDIYNDEVFVSDSGNHRIAVFALDGTWLRNWGGPLSSPPAIGDDELDFPFGVSVYNDKVYILNTSAGDYDEFIKVVGRGAMPIIFSTK